MKYLTAILSLITVSILFNSLVVKNAINTDSVKTFNVPKKINPVAESVQLKSEKDWLAYVNEQKKIELPTEKKIELEEKSSFFPTLKIGDENYQLLGIFKQNKQPFILLKGINTDLVKLQEGDELSKSITLKKITSSAIIILHGEETIKFKLFERSDHG